MANGNSVSMLAGRPQGRRRQGHPAALGPLLRAAGPAGRVAAAGPCPAVVRRGGRRAECLPELLRAGRPRPVPPAGRPRRPLAAAGDDHDPQGRSTRSGTRPGRSGAAAGSSASRPSTGPDDADAEGLARFLSREPTPEAAAAVRRRLRPALRPARRPDPEDRSPCRRLEGRTQRGDRRRAGHLDADRRPQAPADPRHLGGGGRRDERRRVATTRRRRPCPLADRRRDRRGLRPVRGRLARGRTSRPGRLPPRRPGPARAALFRELLALDLEYRRGDGERPDAGDYRARFPEYPRRDRRGVRADRPTRRRDGRPTEADPGATRPTDGRRPAVEAADDAAEALRAAGYEVVRELGRGGMGVVYRAHQVALDRTVALKVIRSGGFATEAERRRFRNEAEAVAQLDHPHIVPIFEVGESRGLHYFSMKLVAGDEPRPAARRLRRRPPRRGPAGRDRRPRRSTTPTSAASSTAT